MVIEANTTSQAFDVFAIGCTLNGTAGKVILDRDQEVLDDEGRIVARITLATFARSFATSAKHGQPLVVGSDNFTLGKKDSDDGYVVTFEVHQA